MSERAKREAELLKRIVGVCASYGAYDTGEEGPLDVWIGRQLAMLGGPSPQPALPLGDIVCPMDGKTYCSTCGKVSEECLCERMQAALHLLDICNPAWMATYVPSILNEPLTRLRAALAPTPAPQPAANYTDPKRDARAPHLDGPGAAVPKRMNPEDGGEEVALLGGSPTPSSTRPTDLDARLSAALDKMPKREE